MLSNLYFLNYYKMSILQKYGEEKTIEVLSNFFRILSEDQELEVEEVTEEIIEGFFLDYVLGNFSEYGNTALEEGEDPFKYMAISFLFEVFSIPLEILEKEYESTIYAISLLFYSTFDEGQKAFIE